MLSLMNYNQVVIPSGTSLSGSFDLRDQQIVRIWGPNQWTAAALTLQGSRENQVWEDLFDQAGTELSLPMVGAINGFERSFIVPRDWTMGVRFIRFRSGTNATAVTQAADRIIVFSYRPFA